MLSRRELIKLGLYGGSGGILHLVRQKSGAYAWALDEDKRRRHEHEHDHDDDEHDDDGRGGPPGGSPPPPPAFTSTLPIPPVKQQVRARTVPGAAVYNCGVHMSQHEVVQTQRPLPLCPGMQPTVVRTL